MPFLPVNKLPELDNAELAKGVNGTMCGSSEHNIVSLFQPHADMAIRRLAESHRAYELLEQLGDLCSIAAPNAPWATGEECEDRICDQGTLRALELMDEARVLVNNYRNRGKSKPEFEPIPDMPKVETLVEQPRRRTLKLDLKLSPAHAGAVLLPTLRQDLNQFFHKHGLIVVDIAVEDPK